MTSREHSVKLICDFEDGKPIPLFTILPRLLVIHIFQVQIYGHCHTTSCDYETILFPKTKSKCKIEDFDNKYQNNIAKSVSILTLTKKTKKPTNIKKEGWNRTK